MLVHGVGTAYDERRTLVAGALHEVGIDPGTMDRYPHEFSGGRVRDQGGRRVEGFSGSICAAGEV